jgi:hypothetical protein
MTGQPSLCELVDAVREFLEKSVMPELKGHTAFHARVAANALALVSRQLEHGADAEREELERLQDFFGKTGTLDEMKRALCDAIRTGNIDVASPKLRDHLERTARAQIEIDQPGYSGLRIAQERDAKA